MRVDLPELGTFIDFPDDMSPQDIQREIDSNWENLSTQQAQRLGVSPDQLQQAQGAAFSGQKIPLAPPPDYNFAAQIGRTEPYKAVERGIRETAASIGGAGVEMAAGALPTLSQTYGGEMFNPLGGQSQVARNVFQPDLPRLQPSQRMQETTYTGALGEMATGEGPSGGRLQAAVDAGTKLVSDTLGIAPSMAATVAGFLVAGPIGAGAMGGFLESASQYENAKAQGKSEQEARKQAGIVGAGTGILNAIPFLKAFDKVLPDRLKTTASNFILRGLAEGATETAEGALPPLAEMDRVPQTTKEATDLLVRMGAGIYDESGVFLPAMITGGLMGGGATNQPRQTPSAGIQPEAAAPLQLEYQQPNPLQIEYQRKIGLDEPSRYPAIPIEPTSGPAIPLGRPQPQQTAYAPQVETPQGIQGLGGADLSRFQPRQLVEGMQGAGPMVDVPEVLNYPQFGYGNVLPTVPTYAPQVAPEVGVRGFGVGESVTKPVQPGPEDTSGAGPYGLPDIPVSPMEMPIRQTPKRLQRFETLFDEASQQTEGAVPPELLMAVAQVESAGNPKAVSPKGAKGLMQIMDATGKELGVTDPFDPKQAIGAAARYIAQGLQRHGGDLDLALADYNAGPGNVDKYGGVPPFKETQEYIRKVRSAMASIQGDNETAALLKVPTESLQALTDMRAQKGTPLTAQEVRNVIGEGDKESAKPIRDWVNREVGALTALGTEAQPTEPLGVSEQLAQPQPEGGESYGMRQEARQGQREVTPAQQAGGVQVPPPAKQPWEMTRAEFVRQSASIPASGGFAARANAKIAKPYHRSLVDTALREGKPVPPAVLADYPDLAEKYQQPSARTSTLQTAAQNLAAIEGKAEPVVSEGQAKAFERLVGDDWSPPKDKDKRSELLQLMRDNVKTRRAKNQQVPEETLRRIALIEAMDSGVEASADEIVSLQVYGHPMATTSDGGGVQNLIPIKIDANTELEWRFEKAQQMVDALQSKIGEAQAVVEGKLKASPAKKKEAKSYLSSTTHDEDAIRLDLLRTETLPELTRLSKEQSKAFERLTTPQPGIPSERQVKQTTRSVREYKRSERLLAPQATTTFGIAGQRDTFEISTPYGAKVTGYVGNQDFPGSGFSPYRGEIFRVDVPKEHQNNNIGTSLIRDAIHTLVENGTETVNIHATTPAGRKLVNRLIKRGYIQETPIRTSESGKNEYALSPDLTARARRNQQQQETPNAIEARQQQQNRQPERVQIGQGGPTAEAGGGNRPIQGGQEQRQVEPEIVDVERAKLDLSNFESAVGKFFRNESNARTKKFGNKTKLYIGDTEIAEVFGEPTQETVEQEIIKGYTQKMRDARMQIPQNPVNMSLDQFTIAQKLANLVPEMQVLPGTLKEGPGGMLVPDIKGMYEQIQKGGKSIGASKPTTPTEPIIFRRVKVGNKTAYDTTVSGRNITIDRTNAEPGLPFEVRVEGQSAPVDFFRTLGDAKAYVSDTLRQEMESEAQADVQPVETAPTQPVVKQELTAEGKRKEPWEMTKKEFEATHRVSGKPNSDKTTVEFPDESGKITYMTIVDKPNTDPIERVVSYEYHKDYISNAIREGKSVPPAVLADYPDLATKYAQPTPEESSATTTQPSGVSGQLATSRPIWKMPFKQYAKERIASEGLKNPADIAEREQDLRRVHRRAVQDAIAAGEKVPVANVKEYGAEKVATTTKQPSSREYIPGKGRVISKEQAPLIEAAKQEYRDVINSDIKGRQRVEAIERARNLVEFYESVRPEKMELDYSNGDQIAYTGAEQGDFREFIYLEGSKKGALGAKMKPEVREQEVKKRQNEWREQQEQFSRLNPQPTSSTILPTPVPSDLMGRAREDYGQLRPILDRQVGNEISDNRKLIAFLSVIEGPVHPDAKTALTARFKEIAPSAAAFAAENPQALPINLRDSFGPELIPKPAPPSSVQKTSLEFLSYLRSKAQEEGLNTIEQKRRTDRTRQAFDEQYPGSGGKAFSDFMRTGNPPKKPKRGSDPTNPQAGVVNLDAPKAALEAAYDFAFKQFVGEFTASRPLATEEAAAFDAARVEQMGVANRAALQKKKLVKSQAAALRAAFNNRAEQRVVRDAIDGLKDGRYRVQAAPEGMNKAQMLQSARDVLSGKSPTLYLPERLANSVQAQREFLDNASRYILENGIATTKGQVAAIKRGIGLWLRRSYEVHDNKNWVQEVQGTPAWKTAIDEMQAEWKEATETPEALTDLELVQFARRHLPGVKNSKALDQIENALQANPDPETLDPEVRAKVEEALRALSSRSRAEFSNRLTTMLSEMANEGREGVFSNRLGSQNRTSLMRRKTIPKWLRDVMGEYTDPEINFARSAEIQAQMIGAWEFSKSLYEAGKGKFIFDDIASVPDKMRKAFDMGEFTQLPDNPKYGMLAGKYVSKEMRAAMDQTRPEMSKVAQLLSQASGTVRWLKTIGNVYTGGGIRNMVSSGFAAAGRGDLPVATVYKMTQKLRSGKSLEVAAAEMLGIPTGEGVNIREKLRQHHEDMVRRGVHDTEVDMNLTRERLRNGLFGKKDFDPNNPHAFRTAKEFSENLWLLGDNFWKSLSVIENTARYEEYAKKQGWTEKQLQKHVDNIVRNTTPTYDAAFPIVNKLKNDILNVVWQDFVTWPAERIRNKVNLLKLIKFEMQSKDPKLVASGSLRLASLLGSHALMTAGLSVVGQAMLGSDDENEDWAVRELMPEYMRYAPVWYWGGRNTDGTYNVADLGYSDADSMMNKVLLASFEGNFDEAANEFIKTFFGASIAFDTFEQLRLNRKESGDPVWLPADTWSEAAYKAMRFATIQAGPPIAAMAWQGYEKYMGKKEEVGSRSLEDRIWSTMGSSNYTINPETSFGFKAKAASGQFRDIRSSISKEAREYPNQKLKDIEKDNAFKRDKAAAELVEYGVAARVAGVSPTKVKEQLKEADIRQDYISVLMRGIERSYRQLKADGTKDFRVSLPSGAKSTGGGNIGSSIGASLGGNIGGSIGLGL